MKALVPLALAALASVAAAEPARFAVVIGNNQPARATAGVLRYADDDAVATHELLAAAGVDSALLTRLDLDSRALHPAAAPAGPPTLASLERAVAGHARAMREARAQGRAVELLLFYSGHGDVEHGEGFVALEDARLTRGRLAELIARAPASRTHVVIDACKSYFMAFARGPGGRRLVGAGGMLPAVGGPDARIGFVLSTSSDRDSHEWERYQGGVFSHQVRSALRGAADVDRDGGVSYAELGAFLSSAAGSVPSPRFRPDFLIRPPGGEAADLDETLLAWGDRGEAVLLDRDLGHVYLEDRDGARLLDAHPAAGQPLAVRVPATRPLFVRSSRDEREVAITAPGPVALSSLAAGPVAIARRGAAHLAFERLFARPFRAEDVGRYRAGWAPPTMVAAGRATSPRRTARTAGATAIVGGSLALALGGVALERSFAAREASQRERIEINRTIERTTIGAVGFASVAAIGGAVWLLARDDEPPPLSIAPTTGGAGLSYGGAF